MADDARTPDAAPRRVRRIGRVFAILGVAVVVLLGAALLFLHTSPARRFVVNQITRLLQQENISFNTDELRYNLLNLRLSLRNVQVRSKDAADLPPFAHIDRISADLSLTSLLRRRYVVESGDAEGISLHYFVDEHGRDNLPRPPRDPEQPSEPLDYLIDQLRVTNATVHYENRAEHIDVVVPVSLIEIDGNPLTDRHDVHLEAAQATLVVQDRHATLDRLNGNVDLGDDDARLKGVEVVAEGARVSVEGTIAEFADPQADLMVRGTLDVARAATVGGLTEPVAGNIAVDARVKGRFATPAIEGRVSGTSLTFRNLSDLHVATTAMYDVASKRVAFSDLDLRAPFGNVSGHGTLNLASTDRSNVVATLSGVDVTALMRAFDSAYVLASRVDAQVEAEWPGMEYLQATGNATAFLTPTTARTTPTVIPVGGRLNLTGRANAVDAVLTKVVAGGAEVNGRIRVVDQRNLDGTARIRVADLPRLIATVESVAGRRSGTLVPVRIAGAVDATTRIGGTVSAPTIAAQVVAPNMTLGSASGMAVKGDLTYTPALLSVRSLDVEWQRARARAAGTVGLSGARPLDLAFTADGVDVAELLGAVDEPQIPATGTLTTQGRIAGTASAPNISATINGTNLIAYNETWGTLAARVTMARREIVVTDLVVDKPQPDGPGRITGSAAYNLDARTYRADLQSQNLQLVGFTLPDGRPVRGILQINARGAGSIDAPSATIALAAEGLQVDTYNVGRLTADAVVANSQANIHAAVPTFATTADVLIGVHQPYPMTAKVRVDDLQLSALPLNLQTPLEGRLRASVDAAGTLGGEGELAEAVEATAQIDAFDGSWNGQPFRIDAPARLRYARQRLAIDQLRLVAQESTLAVNGELPLTERGAAGAINVDVRANLATLARYAPAGTSLTASGDLSLTGVVRGTLKAIDPDLTLVLANGAMATPQLQPGLSNVNVRTHLVNGEAAIEEATANWGTARIVANGRVPLEALPDLPVAMPRRGGPATFTASLQGLDLSQIPGLPEGVTGRVSLDARMAATRADINALEGEITFPELQLEFNGLTLAQQQPSRLALAGGVARVEQFTLTGSVGTMTATGTVALAGERTLNVDTRGNLNVAVMSLFTDRVRAEGDTTLEISARGPLTAPELNGFVALNDAAFVVDEPTIAAEEVNARLELSGRRIDVAQLTGSLNGGTLTGNGFLELGAGGIADAAVQVTTNDVAFDAPLDLRSLSDANVRLTKKGADFVLEGQISLDEAGLTGDINFDEGLLAAMQSRRRLDLTEERNQFLEGVRFNLDIDTVTPILVDNNLARGEVSVDVRLIGSPYEPGLSGRLTLSDESEITLNERRYQVERGVITFIGERRIEPTFDLLLNTTARNYDITIAVTGSPGDTETTLTSDPTLPEPDIMALLVTGRTLEEMRGEEFEVAQEQVLSYLAGRVGSEIGRGLQRATGLSTVRIEPNLIANETEPTARLTVGQEITHEVELIYSTNLTDSNDQIWVVDYDVTRRFQTQAVRQSDNTYRLDVRHDVRIGGQPAPSRVRPKRPEVTAVTITGDGRVPDTELRALLDVEVGDRYDFFAIRDSVENIEEALEERGRLQSRVRLQRQLDATSAALTLRVVAGPRVDLVFEGVTPPRDVLDDVRSKWRRGVFDTQRLDDASDVLRAWLMRDSYLQAKVEGTVEDVNDDQRRVRFHIEPGTRFAKVILAFEGARGISPDELDKIIDQQDLEQQLFTDPTQVTELLERYYREQGYLVASIANPRYQYEGTQARIVVTVDEGPRFVIRDVMVAGNSVMPAEMLTRDLPVQAGDPFLPFAAENALTHIRDLYWNRGYNDVRSDYELVLDRTAGRVDVRFSITEGTQSRIAGITIQGNDKTSEHLVREQLELQPSEVLDLAALARSRRNLYDTGAFSVVDITREELPAVDGATPVELSVSVREVQPIQLRYGASYDTERGPGGIFDISSHNSLGKARVIGLRSRYDGEVREVRGYITQPSLRYWPIRTTGSLYYREDRNRSLDDNSDGVFTIARRGVAIEQERKLRNSYVWSWGYRYERTHTFDPTPGGTFDDRLTVSPLTTTITRETRDDVLDATRGSFASQAFAYSPSWLGSDEQYIKYFGQYFHYFPLQRQQRERFTNVILRPRFVYAVGVRLGLAKGVGELLPRSERFFAGGSSTIRGLAFNGAGPLDGNGVPLGGDAMLVLNNELRLPLLSIFDGVVFSDIGNVFPRVADFSFTDLRKTAGIGLRARTRWFLLRGDYGVLLDPRAGERRSRFYFSIGQAF
jgi:outer membrane protein assembly complex protein YaeT